MSKFNTRVSQREISNRKSEVQKEVINGPRTQAEKTKMARSQKTHLEGKLRAQGMSAKQAEKTARQAVERWDRTIRK